MPDERGIILKALELNERDRQAGLTPSLSPPRLDTARSVPLNPCPTDFKGVDQETLDRRAGLIGEPEVTDFDDSILPEHMRSVRRG